MDQRLKRFLWVGLFFVLGFSIFAPAFDNQFIMDDQTQIVSNPQVHDLGSWADLFTGSTIHEANKAKGSGIYYKPIMLLVYALTWSISHDPMAFHIVQLLFHIFNALMVWAFLAAFLEADLALFAGLVFLVHPFNSETVIYAADLQDVLYEFFGLLSLLVLTKINWGRWRWPAYFVLALLSLLSKESGLLFLFICGVFIWLSQKRDRWRFLASANLTLVIYFILRVGIAGLDIQHDQMTKIGRASFLERIWTAPLVMSHYFYRFFVPVHFTTNQDWIVSGPELLQFFLPLVFLLAVAALTIFLGRKWGQPFFWLTQGHWLASLAVIVAAKVLGTAIEARMFVICKPQLMSIAWFRRLHDWLVQFIDRVHAALHALPMYQLVRAKLVAIKFVCGKYVVRIKHSFRILRLWYRRNRGS